AALVTRKNSDDTIVVKNEQSQERWFGGNDYSFVTLRLRDNVTDPKSTAELHLKNLEDSAVRYEMNGLLLRNITKCGNRPFLGEYIVLENMEYIPKLLSGLTVTGYSRDIFEYNRDKFTYTISAFYSDSYLTVCNIINNGNSNNGESNDYSSEIEFLDTLIKNNHSSLKTYIEDMVTKITNSLNKVDSENKSIDKAIAFDSILNSYYIIRSQKDQIRTEIINYRDNYYLTDSKVKSELDGTISGLDTEFDSITKLINSVNKETVSHTEISNIQKELIEYVHKFSDIIKIISEAGRLISEELRRIQETYTENVRDEILSHLGDILGLEYDPIR